MLIGFAAEHGEGGVARARQKLERKGADMIVMNDISRRDIGFDSDHNELTLVTSDREIGVSRRSKRACAAAIWDAVAHTGPYGCRARPGMNETHPDQRGPTRWKPSVSQSPPSRRTSPLRRMSPAG